MSDDQHEPTRTKVPMPIAAFDDPHLGDAARNPQRVEAIVGGIFVLAIVLIAGFGAAYWQNWSPWILGGTIGAGLFLLGFGLTAWGKYLMPQGPFVEERHSPRLGHESQFERRAFGLRRVCSLRMDGKGPCH